MNPMHKIIVAVACLACVCSGGRLPPAARQTRLPRSSSEASREVPAKSSFEVGQKRGVPSALKALATFLSVGTSASAFQPALGARSSHMGFHSRPYSRFPVVALADALGDFDKKAKPILTTRVQQADTTSEGHVAIVGAGAVGANTAFCIASSKIGQTKITLTDIAEEMLFGQVMDMEDTGMPCTVATPQEAGQADVIIITAGRGLREGETRLDCLKSNYGILKSVVDGLQPIKKSAVIIVVSNPCDILAYHVWKFSGLPSNQVIGSGTSLDTARLRAELARLVNVAPDSINYYMLGEHGDSMFPDTSLATIAGVPLLKWPGMGDVDMEKLENDVRIKGRLIREKKGATSFGVATACKIITEYILQDKKQVLSVSVKIPGEETFLSLPCVIGAQGIQQIVDVTPILSPEEQERWKESLDKISGMTNEIA